jgi:hypothetical protein
VATFRSDTKDKPGMKPSQARGVLVSRNSCYQSSTWLKNAKNNFKIRDPALIQTLFRLKSKPYTAYGHEQCSTIVVPILILDLKKGSAEKKFYALHL